jgi:DNA-binding NarL/FixJ family response regulator
MNDVDSKTKHRNGQVRVFLVDDHPLMRQGVGQLINAQPDMEVCGEAEDASSAMRGIESTEPDAAIIDISLRGSNGIELIKNLKALYKFLPILVLSMHDEGIYAQRVLRAGALGYVMKQEAAEKVVAALRRIMSGEIYVNEKVGSQMLHQALTGRGKPDASPIDRLSDRELEVIEAIGQGKPTREIARDLNVSVKTIESHRAHIKDKIGLKNASELVKFSVQWVENEMKR